MSKERIVRAKRLRDGTLIEVLPDGTTRAFPAERTDWAALAAMTDEEINAAAATDPDNPPRTPERARRLKRVPRIKVMRRALGLTQEEFAAQKSEPDQAARAYLTVIARNPKAVTEALNSAP